MKVMALTDREIDDLELEAPNAKLIRKGLMHSDGVRTKLGNDYQTRIMRNAKVDQFNASNSVEEHLGRIGL